MNFNIKYYILRHPDIDRLYISQDIYKLIEMTPYKNTTGIYAVCETKQGMQVFDTDTKYDGEPYISGMHFRMHFDSFIKFENDREIVTI